MHSPFRTVAPAVAAGVLAAVAFTVAPASAESAITRCSVTDLPLPPNAVAHNTWIAGADVTGRWAVGSTEINDQIEQVVWRNGAVSVPPLPFGTGHLADVNSSGLTVGYGLTMSYASVPVTWSETTGLRELPVPHDGWNAQATGINSRGDIVGTADDPAVFDSQHAVRWPADTPGTVEIMPGDAPHSAIGVDEDGTVLVQKGMPGLPGPAVIWHPADNRVESLGEGSRGIGISGGYVTGYQGADTPMLWNLGGPDREIRSLDIVNVVNGHGSVAGQGNVIERRDGSRIRLQSPGGVPYVTALSDTGIAYGNSGGKPVRWTNCR
ncbi:hypothetical protein ACIA8K_22710 [Catenuloplanes sp. NPDC051500]|uniref:hypothetical protein n=1 Tax=Catenuloplanes sp. NPDC051500 TaxID=3363959 RepID=UPI0037B5E514